MEEKKQESLISYSPVISVLGHVDHGKTSLLDSIRKSSIASGEKGGITQKIGASKIEILHEGKKRFITFIDTPGHEAFANMRSQGVSAADIVLLIVAADDGVKPQTKESIEKIKEAGLPYIVVFTKSDLETAQLEKVKQEVAREGILLEGLGGDVPYISVSSKTGLNIQELLDLIVLVYDMSGIKKDKTEDFMGVVIDAKIDKRRGISISIVIKSGSLAVSQNVFTPGKSVGKIRALIDTVGAQVKESFAGDAVEILGITEVLPAGSLLYTKETALAPKVEQEVGNVSPQSLAAFFGDEKRDTVPIILKTETSGELEAIKDFLPKTIQIVFEGQGDISSSDMMLAKDFKALVIGFNVGVTKDAKMMGDNEKIFYKSYGIIYEMLDELEALVDVIKKQGFDQILGRGVIIASFEGTDATILGVRVDEGRLAVKDKIKVMRKDVEIARSNIITLRKLKEVVKVVDKNTECGVVLSPQVDFEVGDVILSHK